MQITKDEIENILYNLFLEEFSNEHFIFEKKLLYLKIGDNLNQVLIDINRKGSFFYLHLILKVYNKSIGDIIRKVYQSNPDLVNGKIFNTKSKFNRYYKFKDCIGYVTDWKQLLKENDLPYDKLYIWLHRFKEVSDLPDLKQQIVLTKYLSIPWFVNFTNWEYAIEYNFSRGKDNDFEVCLAILKYLNRYDEMELLMNKIMIHKKIQPGIGIY